MTDCQRIESDKTNSELIISQYKSITVEGDETEEARIGVRLRKNPIGIVNIPVSVSDASEARIVSDNILKFNHENYSEERIVRIVGLDDDVRDGDIAYDLVFGEPTLNSTNQFFSEVRVPLLNSDANVPQLMVSSLSNSGFTYEGTTQNTVNFSIKLKTQPTADVTVNLTSMDTSEGQITQGSQLTFNTGNWNMAQAVSVTGQDDQIQDGNVDYIIDIAPISSSDQAGYNGLDPDNITLTNRDNDTAQIIITRDNNFYLHEDGSLSTNMRIRLASQPTANVDVEIRNTSVNTDLDICASGTAAETFTFSAVNWNTDRICTLNVLSSEDDDVQNGLETAEISVVVIFSQDAFYANLVAQTVEIQVLDDDQAGVETIIVDGATTESGDLARVRFRLNSQPVTTASLDINLGNNNDEAQIREFVQVGSVNPTTVNANSAVLPFDSTNWNIFKEVVIEGSDDNEADGDIHFDVDATINQVGTNDANYLTVLNNNPIALSLVNIDNDSSQIWISGVRGSITEGGDEMEVDIQLTSQPLAGAVISVPFTIDDTGEAVLSGVVSPFNFNSTNWNMPQTIAVRGVDDDTDDGDVNLNLVFNPLQSSANDGFSGVDPDDFPLVNYDNDTSEVILSQLQGLPSENGDSAFLDLSLGANPGADVNVAVTLVSGATLVQLLATNGNLPIVFPQATWNTPQRLEIRGRDLDSQLTFDQEATLGFTITSANAKYNAFTLNNLDVAVVDNDAPEIQTTFPTTPLSENGGNVAIAVNLFPSPADKVVIRAQSGNTGQAIVVTGTLTWQNGAWLGGNNSITVSPVNDAAQDGNQDVPITVWLDQTQTTDNVYKAFPYSVTRIITVNDDD